MNDDGYYKTYKTFYMPLVEKTYGAFSFKMFIQLFFIYMDSFYIEIYEILA